MARNAHPVLPRGPSPSPKSLPPNTNTASPLQPARGFFREYYFLYRIASTLTDKMSPERPLREVKKIVRDFFRPQAYAFLLWEEATESLRLKSHFGFARGIIENGAWSENDPLRAAIRRKQPMQFSGGSEGVLLRLKPVARRGNLLLVPFRISAPQACGALLLYRRKPQEFSAHEIKLLQKIATQLGKVLGKIAHYEQTRALSITDALTGVYNRRHFNDRYAAEFMRALRYQRPLSILVIDIDHFKKFNDKHGHLVGDKVLKMTAAILEESIRKADILARFGGEEFVVVLPEIDKQHGLQVAEKLRRAIEHTHFPKEESQPFGHITASFGLASFPEDAVDDHKLLALADQALYQAKANGRNRVEAAQAK